MAQARRRFGMTRRALQLALKRPAVRTHMQDEILTALGVSAMRAAKRMDGRIRPDWLTQSRYAGLLPQTAKRWPKVVVLRWPGRPCFVLKMVFFCG
jgi:hypothetical protein